MNLKLLKLISYQLKKLFQANTVLECIRVIIDYFFILTRTNPHVNLMYYLWGKVNLHFN